jgi:hypothetical protein
VQTTALPPAAAAAAAAPSSASRASASRQQQQHAVVMPPGLMLSCLKALSKCLDDRSSQPASVLDTVARLAALCLGCEP